MAILVCGGAGYIGSHINKYLNRNGLQTVILDNLVYGHKEAAKWGKFIQGDLSNQNEIDSIFETYNIEAVLHLAAYAYVGESVVNPEKYYYNNVVNTLNLLHAMKKFNCKNIIFSSTCATYGEPETTPIMEEMNQKPINPYGYTKLAVENILKDYSSAYGLNFVVLRYFNAAGADPEGEIGESHTPETHIIPLVLDAASGNRKSIDVYGTDYDTNDGSCIRDYIHVTDLAEAHYLALQYLLDGGKSDCFNLGNEKGTSVLEIIDTVRAVTNRDFTVNLVDRRPGDPAILVGSSKKIKELLKWNPQYANIGEIIKHAWYWHENKSY